MSALDIRIPGIKAVGAGLCAGVLAPAALAASTSAASLKLTVPAYVKKGTSYGVKIDGSFKKRELKGRGYLISLIQYAPGSCRRTAQDENAWAVRTGSSIDFYLAPGGDPARGRVGLFETKSPFTRADSFRAASAGTRHVCTYLYPRFIHAGDATPPIAHADKRYKVTRR
jgi:hypothetical protein